MDDVRIASATLAASSPRACSAAGFSSTRASRRRPPCTMTSATPGRRDSSGLSIVTATSRSRASDTRSDVSENPSTGNNVGFITRASMTASLGSADRTVAICACTRWSMRFMSERHAPSTVISAEQRLVLDRISPTPGTRWRDSSIGRVTVRSIVSLGCSPLSARMVMRGNVTSGRIDVGRPSAATTPSPTTTAKPTAIARRCACTPAK